MGLLSWDRSSIVNEGIKAILNFLKKILQSQNASKMKKVHKQTKKTAFLIYSEVRINNSIFIHLKASKKKVTLLVYFLCSLKRFSMLFKVSMRNCLLAFYVIYEQRLVCLFTFYAIYD